MSMPTRLFREAFQAMIAEMSQRLTDDEIVIVIRQMRKQGPRFARNEILRYFSGNA